MLRLFTKEKTTVAARGRFSFNFNPDPILVDGPCCALRTLWQDEGGIMMPLAEKGEEVFTVDWWHILSLFNEPFMDYWIGVRDDTEPEYARLMECRDLVSRQIDKGLDPETLAAGNKVYRETLIDLLGPEACLEMLCNEYSI